jgi:hypothetical protein
LMHQLQLWIPRYIVTEPKPGICSRETDTDKLTIKLLIRTSFFDGVSLEKLLLRVKVKAITRYGLAALPELGQGAQPG